MTIPYVTLAMLGLLAASGCANTVETPPNDQADSPITGQPCVNRGEDVPCGTNDDGAAPSMACEDDVSGVLVWTECVVQTCVQDNDKPCTGENGLPGIMYCERSDTGSYGWSQCLQQPYSSASTPLLFSFDGRSATLANAPGVFNVNPTMSVTTDWPSAMTPWLALDRNHNGVIDDGGELFGSATSLSSGGFAKNGFAALAVLDQNHDGRIDANDPAFNALKVWSDINQDRKSQPGELRSLADMGIQSIELGFKNNTHCNERGNCEIEASTFTFTDLMGGSHIGRIADVHLKHH